jgi:hypothetical protein
MLAQDDYITATELGLEGLNPFISCNISEDPDNAGRVLAILTVQEDFAFHRNLDADYFLGEDEDYALTGEAEEALKKLVEDRYKGENFHTDDTGGEWFEFDLVLSVEPDTTPEDLGVKFWEHTALVQFHNEADPGTFGSQYLFGSLLAGAMRK